MSEQKNLIEDDMKKVLRGKTLANALDFIVYLRENGFTNDDEYGNNFYYMGEPTSVLLCFENDKYPDGEWGIFNYPIKVHDRFPLDDDLQEFARLNVRICTGECGCPTWPRGGNKTVYGKDYEGVCSSTIVFLNPDVDALVKIKTMFDNWKLIVADSKENAKDYL